MASGRRKLSGVIRFAGRSWEDVAPELENLFKRLWESEANGIPSGFNGIVPDTIEATDLIGDPGTEGSGWAAANHVHPVDVDSLLESALAFAFLGY
jgi:hypothetical protein